MVQPAGAEPRSLQSWVAGWGGFHDSLQGLQDGLQSLQSLQGLQFAQGTRLPDMDEVGDKETDWEEALRRQNASNDELCSENGRLQLEIERLRADEEAEGGKVGEEDGFAPAVQAEEPTSDKSGLPTSLEDELLKSVLAAVQDVLTAHAGKLRPGPEEDGVVPQDDQTALQPEEKASPAWEEDILASIARAVETALGDEARGAAPPAMTATEEMALLVGEKMALREAVEAQQDRIESLENELRDMGSAPPPGASLSGVVARGLSELSAALAPRTEGKAPKDGVAIGGEYEIISGRGAIVRNGDSLRSEMVAELPPGSRVRVVAISTKYPRRVEIIFVPREEKDGLDHPEHTDAVEDSAASPPAPAQRKGLVGWISASSKDGRLLIRAAPTLLNAGEACAANCEGGQEEAWEETGEHEGSGNVTLSAEEWECLNEANAVSVQRVSELTSKLGKTGSELVQSFEMRSVLAQLQQGLRREQERASALRELAAMATEELAQHRCIAKLCMEAANEMAGKEAMSQMESSHGAEPDLPEETQEARAPVAMLNLEPAVWERLLRERETTAAALAAALQRLASLAREAEELKAERDAAEGQGQGELVGLREKLRRRVFGRKGEEAEEPSSTQSAPSRPSQRSAEAVASASKGLYQHRAKELRRAAGELRAELQLALEGELALRRSLAARSDALRSLLYRAATAGLNLPQCGPLRIPIDPGAERAALVAAVQEQLRWNLQLRSGSDERPGD